MRNTRKTIVKTAKKMIYHRGFAATTYGEISKETGIAKGNIQYYFKSKEALLFATLDERAHNIKAGLKAWEAKPDPKARISHFIGMLELMAVDLSKYGCPVGTLNDELGKAHKPAQKHAQALFDLYLNWLETQFAAILPPEQAETAAEHLLTMGQGASLLAHAYQSPALIRRQTKAMRAWLAGL